MSSPTKTGIVSSLVPTPDKAGQSYRFPVSFDEVFERDGGGDSVGQLDCIVIQEIQQQQRVVLVPLDRLQELLS